MAEVGEDVQDSAVHRDAQGDNADEASALRFAGARRLIHPLQGVGEAHRGPACTVMVLDHEAFGGRLGDLDHTVGGGVKASVAPAPPCWRALTPALAPLG